MVDPQVAGSAAGDRTHPDEAASFSPLRVLATVVIAGIVAGAAYGVWTFANTPKGLVACTGRVLYQGKPVVGSVMTQNLDDKFDSAGGTLDEDGRFTLDTNGEPGANAGRHKLAIISFERGAPPRPLVPADYTNISSTPLIIEVTADPAANHEEFTLEGSAPEPPEPPAPREASPPGSGSPPGPGSPPSPGSPPGPPGESAPSEPEKPPAS